MPFKPIFNGLNQIFIQYITRRETVICIRFTALLTTYIMAIDERAYQTEHIDRIIASVSSKRKTLAQAPTGSGKTVIFSLITQRVFRNTGKSVLILVHREELMFQAQRTIKEMLGIDAALINAKTKQYRISRVYIGMVDSVTSRTHLFDNVGLVIIDECHIANFNKMHNLFLEELIIGFSATPKSSSGKHPLNKFYNEIVCGLQIKELISMGYLAQNITRCPKEMVDSSKFEVDKLKGDYKEGVMAIEYKKPKNIINTVKCYLKYCKNKKTLIFNVNIEHSKEVNEAFVECGYNSRNLDSNCTAEERREILQWFKVTPDAILNNVMITTVGFDEPTVVNVILNFSTLSLVKFIQCAGRGGRTVNEELALTLGIEPKFSFNIIDLGGNCMKFGDWNDDRDWSYIFENPHLPGNGVAPVKTCPECEGLVHASLKVCPLDKEDGTPCLHEFVKTVAPQEKEYDEMILITKGIDVDELISRNKSKFDYYTFLEIGDMVVKNMYEIHKTITQKVLDESFDAYYEKCKEWYNKNLAGKNGNIPDISLSSWHIIRAKNNFNSLVEKYKFVLTN